MTLKLKHFGIFVLGIVPPIVAGSLTYDVAHNVLLAFIPAAILVHVWTRPISKMPPGWGSSTKKPRIRHQALLNEQGFFIEPSNFFWEGTNVINVKKVTKEHILIGVGSALALGLALSISSAGNGRCVPDCPRPCGHASQADGGAQKSRACAHRSSRGDNWRG